MVVEVRRIKTCSPWRLSAHHTCTWGLPTWLSVDTLSLKLMKGFFHIGCILYIRVNCGNYGTSWRDSAANHVVSHAPKTTVGGILKQAGHVNPSGLHTSALFLLSAPVQPAHPPVNCAAVPLLPYATSSSDSMSIVCKNLTLALDPTTYGNRRRGESSTVSHSPDAKGWGSFLIILFEVWHFSCLSFFSSFPLLEYLLCCDYIKLCLLFYVLINSIKCLP